MGLTDPAQVASTHHFLRTNFNIHWGQNLSGMESLEKGVFYKVQMTSFKIPNYLPSGREREDTPQEGSVSGRSIKPANFHSQPTVRPQAVLNSP